MYRYDRFCRSLSLCTVLVSMHVCVVCLLSVRARLVRCVRAVFFAVSSVCVCYIYISIIIYRGGVFDARAGVTDPEPRCARDRRCEMETHIPHPHRTRLGLEISPRETRESNIMVCIPWERLCFIITFILHGPLTRGPARRPRAAARARVQRRGERGIFKSGRPVTHPHRPHPHRLHSQRRRLAAGSSRSPCTLQQTRLRTSAFVPAPEWPRGDEISNCVRRGRPRFGIHAAAVLRSEPRGWP